MPVTAFPVEIDFSKSYGSWLYDCVSNNYLLDMHNHYSSLPLGYNHPIFKTEEFQNEILKVAGIKTAMGRYWSRQREEFMNEFKEFAVPSGYTYMHFACTGSLAVEAAIKTAWEYGQSRRQSQICVLNDSFHGVNSFGNFISTTNRVYDNIFMCEAAENEPMSCVGKLSILELIGFIDKRKINPSEAPDLNLAAVIIEPIQCTAGDLKMNIEDLKKIRDYCSEVNALLIFDEIQTGFGTTGTVWYWQQLGIEPDIIIFGKKAQVSGIIVKEEFSAIFENYAAKLSVTFDGDLIDMIRCKYIIKAIQEENLLENIKTAGVVIKTLLQKYKELKNVRVTGGLVAFDFETKQERDLFVNRAFENGLIVNSTAEKSIRMRPNLAITMEEMIKMGQIVDKTIFDLYLNN